MYDTLAQLGNGVELDARLVLRLFNFVFGLEYRPRL